MHNITLIGSVHSEIGKCNSDELYKILEFINPEVIFGELSSNLFDIINSDLFDNMYCNLHNRILFPNPPEVPLELKCMKKYLQNHNIKYIPVNIDVNPNLSESEKEMFATFNKEDDYKKLEQEQYLLTKQYGFDYLNSDKHLDLSEQMKNIEKNIVKSEIHKNRLPHIYKLFRKKYLDIPENAMLLNIYNYSKENQYNQAVFLIGAGHRKSIMQKIIEYEKVSEIKLNWTIYDNKQKNSR